MKKYLISVLVLTAVLFSNCKKHDEAYKEDFPSTYLSSEWHSGAVKLFSKNGEISDAKTINSFIERRGAGNTLYFGNQVVDSFTSRVAMYTPDSVVFDTNTGRYICRLTQSGNVRLLQYRDTITTYSGYSYEGLMYILKVKNGFSQYLPLYEEVSHDIIPRYRVKPVFPMQRTADGMEITFINSVLYPPNWSPTVQFYVNRFTGKGYSGIAENDTLLIQERTLIMKKRSS